MPHIVTYELQLLSYTMYHGILYIENSEDGNYKKNT